jgi:hypothetical protein
MKKCTKCRVEKDEVLFAIDRANKTGVHGWCKECKAKHRKHNREKINETERKYRAANKEQFAKKDAEYNKRKVKTLLDGYVVSKILKGTSLKSKDIQVSLIEAKRTQMLINRTLKEMKNAKHQ